MRHVRAVCALIVSLLLLGACSGASPRGAPYPPAAATSHSSVLAVPSRTPATVSITFACYGYQHEQYEGLALAFEAEHPGIAIRVTTLEAISGSQYGITSEAEAASVAAAADAFLGFAQVVTELAVPQALVLDLAPLADGHGLLRDGFFEAPLALLQDKGRLWGLPFVTDVSLIYFDPGCFDEVGLPYPAIGWSWEDLRQAALHAALTEGDGVSRYGFLDLDPAATLLLMAEQRAGPLLDNSKEPAEVRLDTPVVAEALRWYGDLLRNPGAVPDSQTDLVALQAMRQAGSSCLWSGGSSELSEFGHARVVPYPGDSGGVSTASAQAYFVSSGTTQPEAAWLWIEYLSRQDIRRLPGQIPARRTVAEASHCWDEIGPHASYVIRYCIEHSASFVRPLFQGMRKSLDVVGRGQPVEVAQAEGQALAEQRLAEAVVAARASVVAEPQATPTTEAKGITIHFRTPYDYGTDPMPYRVLAQAFHGQHPDITVVVEAGTPGPLQRTAADADCFVEYYYRLQLDGTDSVLPLDPLIERGGYSLAGIRPEIQDYFRRDGRLWALPLDIDAQLLHFNKDVFDEAGEPYPTEAWTTDDLVDAAVRLANAAAEPPVYGFLLANEMSIYGNLPSYLGWLGGQVMSDGEPAFDGSSAVDAMLKYLRLVEAMPPLARAYENVFGVSGFATMTGGYPALVMSGQVAMWSTLAGSGSLDEPPAFRMGVAPLPAGMAPAEMLLPRGLFVSAYSPHAEACWQWLEFISRRPDAVALLPADLEVAKSDAWRARVGDELAAAWVSLLERQASLSQTGTEQGMRMHLVGYWLAQALHETVEGRGVVETLADAREAASLFLACYDKSDGSWEAVEACALEADPEVVLPKNQNEVDLAHPYGQ